MRTKAFNSPASLTSRESYTELNLITHKIHTYSWNVDPFERYNTLNFILGYSLILFYFFGTHQATVQRYSSLPTLKDAVKSVN
jgi:hypothetical protein